MKPYRHLYSRFSLGLYRARGYWPVNQHTQFWWPSRVGGWLL